MVGQRRRRLLGLPTRRRGDALRGAGGSIVNTASIAALGGDPILPVDSATKHAVLGLTRAFAFDPDVARAGIRVNCVCTGDMDTR